MDFFQAIETCFSKYAIFRGRAPRSEYWWFIFFNAVVSITARVNPILSAIVPLALLLPHLAVAARRLHDTDRSAWFLFLPVVPAVSVLIVVGLMALASQRTDMMLVAGIFGAIATLGCYLVLNIWYCQRGTLGPNRFGDDPLPTADP
jgi:uncharacterized membrane protein YhaH (DUF805 family)